eukprot:s850_g1.t4
MRVSAGRSLLPVVLAPWSSTSPGERIGAVGCAGFLSCLPALAEAGAEASWLPAVEGAESGAPLASWWPLDREGLEAAVLREIRRFYGRPVSDGEVGVFLSHRAAWTTALNAPFTLILEDDAVPMSFLPPAAANGDVDEESEAAYFRLCAARWASVWSALTQATEALGQRGSWDMLLVGRHRFGEDRPIPGEHDLVDAGFSTCLHAYAVSRKGAERLLELTALSGEDPLGVVIPIDDLLPGVWTGCHPRTDVKAHCQRLARRLSAPLRVFAFREVGEPAHSTSVLLAMVRFVRPGLLRTTSLSRTFSVLLELCRPESSAEKAQAFLHSTESADRVGAFISHSWRAKPLPKILALCYELNVSMAVKACWLTWLVVSMVLLASADGTSEDMRDTLGSIALSPWIFFLTVDLPLIVFFMFFFFAHGLTFEFWTPSVWFDKACINQEDQAEKEEAIAILPEILHRSSRILVVWDPTLFSRLWCNLEIATFAKSHREDQDAIRILQPWVTPWLLCSMFAEWLAARVLLPWYGRLLTAEENIVWHPGSFLDYLVAGLISGASFGFLQLPALWLSAVFFSYKLKYSADILHAFANFDVRNAQCSMSSDRTALHAQIARVFDEIEDAPLSIEVEVPESFPRSPPEATLDPELVELIRRPSVRRFTSYPSEEMCLDLFNTFVRNELRCQIVEETGRPSHLPLGLAILGALPLQLWLISDIYLQCEQVGCKTVPSFYYLNSTDQYWVFVSVATFYDTVLAKPLLYTAALRTLDRVYSIRASWALEWVSVVLAMVVVQLCGYFFEALVTGCMAYLLAEGVSALPLSLLSLLLFVTTFLWSRAFLR